MCKLSDTINRKFIDSIDINEWEIGTDTGWEDIKNIHKTIEYEEWEIETDTGLSLISADTHILFDENFNEIFVKDIIPNETKIKTKYGDSLVTKVHNRIQSSNMYDVTVNSENHRFYSNDILSHNTVTAVVIILHYVLFNQSKTVALLANKADTAREILERIKLAYEAVPTWLQMGVSEWNKGTVRFENKCKIIAAASNSSSIRGKSISLLYIDEAAFIDNFDKFFASVYPTISAGVTTKILMTSTPNGLNSYWKTCVGAKATGNDWNGYKFIEVNWRDVPGRDDKWREDVLKAMNWDYQLFAQEFENEFLGSSGTLINGNTLKSLVSQIPIKTNDNIYVYEEAIRGHNYVGVVDVSHGKGLDYSTIQIVDVSEMPYKQVCVFRDNMTTPSDFGNIIFRMGKSYNDAVILIELNDMGQLVSDHLHYDLEYENIMSTESAGSIGKRISSGFGKSMERGVRTTKSVKAVGCAMLKLLVEQHQLIINDFNTIQELSTFSKKGNSYEAETGTHDDLVMSLVLFGWMSEQKYFKELTDINTLLRLRESDDGKLYSDLLPVGLYDDGIDNINLSGAKPQGVDPWNLDKWEDPVFENDYVKQYNDDRWGIGMF